MNAKERLKTLIEMIYVIYEDALTSESQKFPERLLKREEIQERQRQAALLALEEEKNRMSSGV